MRLAQKPSGGSSNAPKRLIVDSGASRDVGNTEGELFRLDRTISLCTSGTDTPRVTHFSQLDFDTVGKHGGMHNWRRNHILHCKELQKGDVLLSTRQTQLQGIHTITPARGASTEFYRGGKIKVVGGTHIGSSPWSDRDNLFIMDSS